MNEHKIVFTEKVTSEDIEYIDSCKEKAQLDSEYWNILKDMMNQGYVTIENDNNDLQSEVSIDELQNENDLNVIKSLLEYQTKMLENINYAIDSLTIQYNEIKKHYTKLSMKLEQMNNQTPSMELTKIINTPITSFKNISDQKTFKTLKSIPTSNNNTLSMKSNIRTQPIVETIKSDDNEDNISTVSSEYDNYTSSDEENRSQSIDVEIE